MTASKFYMDGEELDTLTAAVRFEVEPRIVHAIVSFATAQINWFRIPEPPKVVFKRGAKERFFEAALMRPDHWLFLPLLNAGVEKGNLLHFLEVFGGLGLFPGQFSQGAPFSLFGVVSKLMGEYAAENLFSFLEVAVYTFIRIPMPDGRWYGF